MSEIKKRKYKEWKCNSSNRDIKNGLEYECFSKRGNAISVFPDGSVRFTKFNWDYPVKVDGKVQKDKNGDEKWGVELS